jgi:hypothetical protein
MKRLRLLLRWLSVRVGWGEEREITECRLTGVAWTAHGWQPEYHILASQLRRGWLRRLWERLMG